MLVIVTKIKNNCQQKQQLSAAAKAASVIVAGRWVSSKKKLTEMKSLEFNKFRLFVIFSLMIVTISLSFRNTEKELVVSASVDKLNILFYGIENHITIGVENTDRKEVKVSGIDIDLKSLGNGEYSARVLGKTPKIIVETGSTKKILKFKAKQLPELVLSWRYPEKTINYIKRNLKNYSTDFSNIIPMYITTDEAQRFEKFDLKIEGGDFLEDIVNKRDFKIISFSITKVPSLNKITEIKYKEEDKITESKVKQLVNGASKGDTFYIDDVRVQDLKHKNRISNIGFTVFKIITD